MNTNESFRIAVPGKILQKSGPIAFTTEVVTRKGIFARLTTAPVLMAFMRIHFDLPLRRDGVVLNGVVTSIVEATEPGGLHGVSITFYGKGGLDATYWDEFIDAAYAMRALSGSGVDIEARTLIKSLRPCIPAGSGTYRLGLRDAAAMHRRSDAPAPE